MYHAEFSTYVDLYKFIDILVTQARANNVTEFRIEMNAKTNEDESLTIDFFYVI